MTFVTVAKGLKVGGAFLGAPEGILIRDRDAAIQAFENDLKLLFIGPFTVFHMNFFRFPRSSDSALLGP